VFSDQFEIGQRRNRPVNIHRAVTPFNTGCDRHLLRTSTFILAGGLGERLYPLTQSRPKPAVSFGGMSRIIDFTLFNCLRSGLSRVSLLTQYKYEELHRYIRVGWSDLWNGIAACREPLLCLPPLTGKRYRGTADAIFQNANLVDSDSDFVLVLAGDHIYQMNYRDLISRHIETNAELTVAAVEYPLQDAGSFGVLQVDESLRITGFEEKPSTPCGLASNPSMALVSMGVYVFDRPTLLAALNLLCGSGNGFDFGLHIIPALIHSVRAYAHSFRNRTQNAPGYWRDIGTIDAYYNASMELLRTRSQTGARIGAGARVSRSVLSTGVEVEKNATVYDSILMPGVRVGKGAQLRRVIVEEGIQVPAGFCAGFDIEQDRIHQIVTEKGVVVIAQNQVSAASRHDRAESE
jgi:glucose-1-phosphate adenylyltransferase